MSRVHFTTLFPMNKFLYNKNNKNIIQRLRTQTESWYSHVYYKSSLHRKKKQLKRKMKWKIFISYLKIKRVTNK